MLNDHPPGRDVEWNLSNTDTIGTKTVVLISEVFLFQGKNIMYLYKVGTRSSALINEVSLFQRCPLRDMICYLGNITVEERYALLLPGNGVYMLWLASSIFRGPTAFNVSSLSGC